MWIAVFVVHCDTNCHVRHTTDHNFTVVVKSNTVFLHKVALGNNYSVVYVGVNIGTGVVEIVTVGCKHDLATRCLFVVLGNVHYRVQCRCGIISDTVYYPFVASVVGGGIVFTVKQLLCIAVVSCGFFLINNAVLFECVIGIVQDILTESKGYIGKHHCCNCQDNYKN